MTAQDSPIYYVESKMHAHIALRLRRRRRLVGMSQKQLGDAVGVRFQQIQKYECGANHVSAARLWSLADVLGVPMGYFYEDFRL
jgi:transcriptional regulator with XRE-family HTH domain